MKMTFVRDFPLIKSSDYYSNSWVKIYPTVFSVLVSVFLNVSLYL